MARSATEAIQTRNANCFAERLVIGLHRAARRERHTDHRESTEQEVDANQQAERPGCCLRQASENDSGQDQIDNAACQHPTPAAGELRVPRGAPRQRGWSKKSILREKAVRLFFF
jgi:hypothetical protein